MNGLAKGKIGIVRFPGTNCDRDVFSFVEQKSYTAEYLWHLDHFVIADFVALIIPGGFSYGDYLRSGALAARSPIMTSVREFAKSGRSILGICNGFQILTEAGILPGALVRNQGLRFIDDWVDLKIEQRVENKLQYFATSIEKGRVIRLPVAHGDGRFYAPQDDLKRIEDLNLVWLRYQQEINGSLNKIAGIMNEQRNVLGLMPHPERALYDWMGGVDGWEFLK